MLLVLALILRLCSNAVLRTVQALLKPPIMPGGDAGI